jgi:4-hydroxy-tetrahydrodipicolinate synthase
MGEAGSLTREERALVVRSVVEAAAGRVPVTVGV